MLDTTALLKIKLWVNEFLNWLISSEIGHSALIWHNHHGTWHDVICTVCSFFCNDDIKSKRILNDIIPRRLASQFIKDGRQFTELEHSLPLQNSILNLHGHFILGCYCENVGIDYWHANLDGRSLKTGLDFLLPYLTDLELWPYSNESFYDINTITWILKKACCVYAVDKSKYISSLQVIVKKYGFTIDLLYA